MAFRRATTHICRAVFKQLPCQNVGPGLRIPGPQHSVLCRSASVPHNWGNDAWSSVPSGFKQVQTDAQQQQQDPKDDEATPPATLPPDAKQCDSVIHDYDQLRSSVQRNKYPPSYVTWVDRFKAIATGIWGFLLATVRFLVSVPGRIEHLRSLSREDWQQKFHNGWATVKTEAKHYWAGTKLLAYEVSPCWWGNGPMSLAQCRWFDVTNSKATRCRRCN